MSKFNGVKGYNSFDEIYQAMFEHIYENGEVTKGNIRTKFLNGNPAHRKRVTEVTFTIDEEESYLPLITSRKMPIKSAINEIIWIWIKQSNNIKDLVGKFWDEWADKDGSIGKAYGYQMAKETYGHPSQLDYILHEVKHNPNSSRMLTELWIPEELNQMALAPCVHLTQWHVIRGKLELFVRQRSCDFAVGLPNNVMQYSVLHKAVANHVGIPSGAMHWSVGDLHYYTEHEEALLRMFDTAIYSDKRRPSIDTMFLPLDIRNLSTDNVVIGGIPENLPKYEFEIAV